MTRKFLVTGASGFVGAYMVEALQSQVADAEVFGFCFKGRAVPPCANVIHGNLLDRELIFDIVAKLQPDVVIHLAGQSSVASGDADTSGLTYAINVTGTLNLAVAVAQFAPKATFLFASSGEVYGGRFGPFSVPETISIAPKSVYAKSKALGEQILSEVLPLETKLIIGRPFNHTGPGQRENFVLPSFASQIARMEAGLQAPCMAVGNIDVCRDFLDVRDVIDAYIALVAAAPSRLLVNISSDQPRSLRDLLNILRGLSPLKFDYEVDPARVRPTDVPMVWGNSSLLRSLTGWAPRVPLEKTLGDLLDSARRQLGKQPRDC